MEGMKSQRAELSAYMETQARANGVADGAWRIEIMDHIEAFHTMAAAKAAVDAKIAELKGGA